MNLLDEIEKAQRSARIGYDAIGGRGWRRVRDAMSEEARAAWSETKLPNELLVSSDLSQISRYAQLCGITLPQDAVEEGATK